LKGTGKKIPVYWLVDDKKPGSPFQHGWNSAGRFGAPSSAMVKVIVVYFFAALRAAKK
jgi:hypothetical protein